LQGGTKLANLLVIRSFEEIVSCQIIANGTVGEYRRGN
jgi:hypothetical protein